MRLYTIGFTQKSLRQFVGLLREAGVDSVVDIRLNNTSQLAGYAKRDDLAFVLELCGIGYLEEKRLAPTQDILDSYHRDHDWPAYEVKFQQVLAMRPVADALSDIAARFKRPCLLCAEPEPSHCHRRLVAEAFVRLDPGLKVEHLMLASAGGRAHSEHEPVAASTHTKSRTRRKAGGKAGQEAGR
jgi:uncharacterized protein (DUF488 family)